MLRLLLTFVAVLGRPRRQLVWFWAGWQDIAATGIRRLPAIRAEQGPFSSRSTRLFRASARAVFEFTFSLGVLAGLGADYIGRATTRSEVRAAVLRAIVLLAAITAAATLIYGFLTKYLVMATPRPANAGSLSNPDVLFPLSFAVISAVAVWLYFLRPTTIRGGLLVFLLIADLAAFGQFFEWRDLPLQCKPAAGRRSLGEVSQAARAGLELIPHSRDFWRTLLYNYEMLDYPNVSIARGLQSVNGYDALRIGRMAAIAGDMTLDGLVPDSRALNDLTRASTFSM
jgi:hypothetical protein